MLKPPGGGAIKKISWWIKLMGRHALQPVRTGGAPKAHRVRPGKGDVWNASSLEWSRDFGQPAAAASPHAVSAAAAAAAEEARMFALLSLRKQLARMVAKRPKTKAPVMAFDRWRMRCTLDVAAGTDPVLPTLPPAAPAEPGLVDDLRNVGCSAGDAQSIAHQLAVLSTRNAARINSAAAAAPAASATRVVVVTRFKHSIDVLLARGRGKAATKAAKAATKALKINPKHYDKLLAMFARARGVAVDAVETTAFHERLYALLARYHGLQGHGFQAAVGGRAFGALREHFGVAMECFASPLNCRFAAHCSAFPDVDAPFGAMGSFFTFNPLHGSFECNPPFEAALMERCVAHIEALLAAATAAMSFAVIVPAWHETEAWKGLEASAMKRALLVVAQAEHGFCDGAAHQVSESAAKVLLLRPAASLTKLHHVLVSPPSPPPLPPPLQAT